VSLAAIQLLGLRLEGVGINMEQFCSTTKVLVIMCAQLELHRRSITTTTNTFTPPRAQIRPVTHDVPVALLNNFFTGTGTFRSWKYSALDPAKYLAV
jgi:hypothetical protein